MNKLTGAAVFAVTLALALVATSYYNRRYAPPPPAPPHAPAPAPDVPPPPAPPPSSGTIVTYKVRLVTLDLAARQSHTTLVAEHGPSSAAPEKLWVWVGFFVPGDASGEVFSGDPVLVERPFEAGRRATLNVTAACPWCWRRDAPAAGYYARVNVSTVSAADARLANADVSRDLSTAVPVVVEEGRRGAR